MAKLTHRQRVDAILAESWPNACILFDGSKAKGYGRMRIGGKLVAVHRYVLSRVIGPPPADKPYVLHSCRHRSCFNPRHLRYGTQKVNMADRDADGTTVSLKGESNGCAKLTEGQVFDIRQRYAEGGITHMVLAAEYGVSYGLIGHIVARRAWTHI